MSFFWQMGRWLFLRCILLWMIPGVHFGSGEGSAVRLGGFVAGVRFLSFSGLKGPNSGPPRVVVSVDDSRGSLWFRRRFRRTSARLCCGGPLSDTGVTYRAVSLALPRAFNREIQKKERARRQEGKRARGQEGKKAKGEEKM